MCWVVSPVPRARGVLPPSRQQSVVGLSVIQGQGQPGMLNGLLELKDRSCCPVCVPSLAVTTAESLARRGEDQDVGVEAA